MEKPGTKDIRMGLFRSKLFNKKKTKGINYPHSDPFVQNVISDPEFPYLVSFPRTGSHWLRMLMEYYFKVPSLVRIFEYTDSKEFTCYHTHDLEVDKLTDVQCKNCIYLYRKPVDTVYSIMKYYKADLGDSKEIKRWSVVYAQHLEKWLINEDFTKNKLIVTYDGIKSNINEEFQKICKFFNREFDPKRLKEIYDQISKDRVYDTIKNNQIINRTADYEDVRSTFIKTNEAIINKHITDYNQKLEKYI